MEDVWLQNTNSHLGAHYLRVHSPFGFASCILLRILLHFLQYHAYFQPVVVDYEIWKLLFQHPLPTLCSMKRTVIIHCCKVWSGNWYTSISNRQLKYAALEHSQIHQNIMEVLFLSFMGRRDRLFNTCTCLRQHCFQPIVTRAESALLHNGTHDFRLKGSLVTAPPRTVSNTTTPS